MRVTIDTKNKTLEILSSFHYADFATFRSQLPVEWRCFLTLIPVESVEGPLAEFLDNFKEPPLLEQKPYPLTVPPTVTTTEIVNEPTNCECGSCGC